MGVPVSAQPKFVSQFLSGIAWLVSLWGLIHPRPYQLVMLMLAVLPWIALEAVRRSHGRLRLDTTRNNSHPNVAIVFLLPGLVLLFRSIIDYNILQPSALAWFSIGAGCLLCVCTVAADPSMRANPGIAVVILTFSIGYGYGVAAQTNVLLDRSPEASYTAAVQSKQVVRGRRIDSYQLNLGPWGPETAPNRLRVSRRIYDYIQAGDVVSLALKRGALGASWCFVRASERRNQAAVRP